MENSSAAPQTAPKSPQDDKEVSAKNLGTADQEDSEVLAKTQELSTDDGHAVLEAAVAADSDNSAATPDTPAPLLLEPANHTGPAQESTAAPTEQLAGCSLPPPPPPPEPTNHTESAQESAAAPAEQLAGCSLPPPPPPPEPTNHTESAQESAAAPAEQLAGCSLEDTPIVYSNYESELQMPEIMRLIQKDLSEPYSIYTYRYFINNWPNLCFLARHGGRIVGAIVCKLDSHDSHTKRAVTSRGYIAMLAVDQQFRKRRIGSCLVLNAIRAMAADAADEVVLETEVTNKGALRLYENLGFVRDKRLFRYYLNGVDALRLKLWLWPP